MEKNLGRGGWPVSRRSLSLLGWAMEEIEKKARPRLLLERMPLSVNGNEIFIAGRGPVESVMLKRIFSQCVSAFVFLTTLGSEIDDRLARAQTNDMSRAYFLDLVASCAAEKAAAYAESQALSSLGRGEAGTGRYSPGYCDWPLTQQRLLFSLVDAGAIGVSLTDECLMRPEKSVSGIIGIGPEERVRDNKNICFLCAREDCSHRRCQR